MFLNFMDFLSMEDHRTIYDFLFFDCLEESPIGK